MIYAILSALLTDTATQSCSNSIKRRLLGCVWNVFFWTKAIHLQYLAKYVLCYGRNVIESFVKNILHEQCHVKNCNQNSGQM
jgi:hypothetical protein